MDTEPRGRPPRRPVEVVVAEEPDFPPRGAPRGPADLSGIDLVMLGHAHIDLGYRWDVEETIHRIAPDTFRGVLCVMDRTPGFTFCQSQMFLYAAMERHYPELFGRMRDAIRSGRWEVIGGSWCEYDAVLPSGESVIRQHLQGLRYAAEHLGVTDNEVGFVPDSFISHSATLPQILAGCGIRSYLFGRGLPAAARRAFRWVGPDGSSVVAYLPFGPYANPPFTAEHLATLKPYAEAAVGTTELALYGLGDHGGGPREADIAALEALRAVPTAPSWRYGRGGDFFRTAFAGAREVELRAYAGSLRSFATGALTSQAPTKRQNRLCEHLLLQTEAVASLATMLERKPAHPRVDFCVLWRELLTQQFHDILPGTSVAAVYRQALSAYDRVRRQATLLREDALERIRSRLDTKGEGLPLVVVNTGLGPAAGIVDAPYPAWLRRGTPYELRDPEGREIEAVWADETVSFVCSLPPLSYRLYRAIPAAAPRVAAHWPAPAGASETLRRGDWAVSFDPATGDPGVEVAGRPVAAPAFSLELWEEEEKSTSWVLAPTGTLLPLELVEAPRVVREDRFRTVVRTVSRSAWSTFTRELTLYEDCPRLDLTLRVDWQESDALLKLRLRGPSPEADQTIRTSLAHGCETVSDPTREFCMHDWVDVADRGGGLAVLTDGAYGADVTERGLGISVLRTARDMDPAMAHGEHTLRLALLPYRGAFKQSRLAAALGSFAESLDARFCTRHRGALMSWGRIDSGFSLPPTRSFVSVDRANVAICAVKLPEEHYTPDALVVRIRELDGQSCRCSLRLPLAASSVWIADHLERPLHALEGQRGEAIEVDLAPFQIQTLVAYL